MAEAPTTSAVAHVSGIVVHAAPARSAAVAAAIAALDGAEIYGREEGKLVVVLEAADEQGLHELFNRVSLIDGVCSTALVSHYRDDPVLMGGE